MKTTQFLAAVLLVLAVCEEHAACLGGVPEAPASSAGAGGAPATPVRLGLLPFKDLAEGPAGGAGGVVDGARAAAAVTFVPHMLRVTRAASLDEDSSGSGSGAVLAGVIVVPGDLAPPVWGRPRLVEVIDARGGSLLRERDEHRLGDWCDLGPSQDLGPAAAQVQRGVRFEFAAPEWAVKEIRRFRAIVPLKYPGPAQVVKLPQAVLESWIRDPFQSPARGDGRDGGARRAITNETLRAAGIEIQAVAGCAAAAGTVLNLSAAEAGGAVTGAQVFDAGGAPWPTEFQRGEAGGRALCTLRVTGRPQPPLSLALVVTRLSATVDVPLVLERIPVGND